MCGICGFVDYTGFGDKVVLDLMVDTLTHRGPDDRGSEISIYANFRSGIGQTRLSIIDVSPAGHQPMNFEHLSIVLNGEIYNYNEIKRDLIKLGHKFISGSDTEVVLHAYLEWGASSVSRFIGMFAFVILDKKKQELILIRDRAGVKPLFYYWFNGLFLFSSELKAFHAHPGFTKKLNGSAVRQYFDFLFVPSPYCIFENCHKLDPGHILRFNLNSREMEMTKYWDVHEYYSKPKLKISYEDAMSELEQILISSFEYRMVADVPVGIFLSGGYDSSAVTAMLQTNRTEQLKTFTIGFNEGNNEAPYAKDIAGFIGTDHTEYYCTTEEAQEIIPSLPYFYDEPFADSSAIPTILVSKLARSKVTVALSADAGDEIFGGYTYYRTYQRDIKNLMKIHGPFRKSLAVILNGFGDLLSADNGKFQTKLSVYSEVLRDEYLRQPQNLHHNYFLLNKKIGQKLFKETFEDMPTAFEFDFSGYQDNLSVPLATDYVMYLQNDILTKVDRATMSVSLEGREPFLDHRIVEFAAQLPNEYKISTVQKRILRDITYKYIPHKFLDRPKTGFTIPLNSWLRKDLKHLVEEHLNASSIKDSGLFNADYVCELRKKFYDFRLSDPTLIWKILQFQMWYKRWM